jgi:hypothetical protein
VTGVQTCALPILPPFVVAPTYVTVDKELAKHAE